MKNLEYLNLSDNNICDASLDSLSMALKTLNKVKTLILAGNDIDDKGLSTLTKDLQIDNLDLSNNQISIEGEKTVVRNQSKRTKIIFSGKSMYGSNQENQLIKTTDKKKPKNRKICCIIN